MRERSRRRWFENTVLFGRTKETVHADVLEGLTNLTELTSDTDYGAVSAAENARTLRVNGHGYRWFRGRHPG